MLPYLWRLRHSIQLKDDNARSLDSSNSLYLTCNRPYAQDCGFSVWQTCQVYHKTSLLYSSPSLSGRHLNLDASVLRKDFPRNTFLYLWWLSLSWEEKKNWSRCCVHSMVRRLLASYEKHGPEKKCRLIGFQYVWVCLKGGHVLLQP